MYFKSNEHCLQLQSCTSFHSRLINPHQTGIIDIFIDGFRANYFNILWAVSLISSTKLLIQFASLLRSYTQAEILCGTSRLQTGTTCKPHFANQNPQDHLCVLCERPPCLFQFKIQNSEFKIAFHPTHTSPPQAPGTALHNRPSPCPRCNIPRFLLFATDVHRFAQMKTEHKCFCHYL